MRVRIPIALLFVTLAVQALGVSITTSFPNGASRPPDFTRLVITFEERETLTADNECQTADACRALYRLENRTTPYATTAIDSVKVTRDSIGFPTLEVTLHEAPKTLKALTFVALNIQATAPPGLVPAAKGYVDVPVGARMSQVEDDGTEPFKALRGDQTLTYRSLIPVAQPGDLERFLATLSNTVSVTDPNDFDRQFPVSVTGFKTTDDDHFEHEITIIGTPRGKKLNVKVSGVEKFGTEDVAAATTMQTKAIPKSRDEADLWLRLAMDADSVKTGRKYTVDARIHTGFRRGRWDIGPTLDAIMGNVTSKAPNTAALSFDAKYWAPRVGPIQSQSWTFSPIYRTDRDFKNRDLGADVVYEPIFKRLDQTLDARRKHYKAEGGPPLAINWGWRIRPSIAVEAGRHIDSESPEVRDKSFHRLRLGVTSTLEWMQWKLGIAAQWRHLGNDEVLRQVSSTGVTVITTSKSSKAFGRIDVSYDLGSVAIVATHLNGRQPPAYSSTHSTSLGILFKF